MCDNNSSEKSKCSGKEKVSRCKHGHRKSSTGNAGANGRRASKRDSTERKSLDSTSPITAPENTCGCEGQDTQRIGSFRKDSVSTKGLVSERVGSSETTLKTGNEINIVPTDAGADNIEMQNCGEGQRRSSSSSQRRSSTQLENFDQNQAPNPEMSCSCNSQQRDSIKDDYESTSNNAQQDNCSTGQSIKSCPSPDNCESQNKSVRRSSTTSKKSCTFKLPGTVCELPDEDCDNAIQEFANQGLMNAEEECDDEEYDYANGKRGHYKTIKYRKNPTTVTNLREKIQQYVRNRPDQLKPAPEKLTPFRDPVFTQCFEPIDEELERQLKEEREAAKRLAEERKLESEVQCYKKVIPFTLPCKTQLEYLDCLGASPLARVKYLEYSKLMKEAESFRRRMPCDWSCEQQREYLDCMGVSEEVKEVLACSEDADDLQGQGSRGSKGNRGSCTDGNCPAPGSFDRISAQQNAYEAPSSFTRASSDTLPFSPPNSFLAHSISSQGEAYQGQTSDLGNMIQKCKNEFRASGLNVDRPPASCKNADNARSSLDARRSKRESDFYAKEMSRGSVGEGYGEKGTGMDYDATGNYDVTKSYDVSKSYDVTKSYEERRTSGERQSYGVMEKSSDASGERISSYKGSSVQVERGGSRAQASFQQGEYFLEEDDEDPSDTESDLNNPMFGKQAEAPPPTMAEEMILYKRHLATIRKRYFGALCKEMESAETITPDIAAAMVYSGELGLSMKAAPEKVYDFLYPDAPGNETITIADVMTNLPKGLDDIVVPIVPPITIESRNYPDMEDPAMLDSPRVIQIGPALNLIDEPEVKGLLDPIDIKELVTGHTSANYLELMFPEAADMQLEEEEESEEKALEKAREEMFNIELVGSLPQHFSQVQMRGTIPPSWFPGYWTASPSREGVFKSSRPSEVMEYIWEEMQPERVRPAGAAYIIGN